MIHILQCDQGLSGRQMEGIMLIVPPLSQYGQQPMVHPYMGHLYNPPQSHG